jgi:NADPH-dependent F420 reductase
LQQLREPLAGKVVVSCVNPLGFDKRGPYALAVPEGSAAEQAAAELPDSRVVAAFHHVSAVNLLGEKPVLDDEDVLVCGDDADAKQAVCELASTVTGRLGIDAGSLRLAHQLESLTAVLISINKRYRARSGVRITNL